LAPSVLLLDDEENIRRDLGGRLMDRNYLVHTAASIDEAKKIILSEHIDFAIVDLKIDTDSDFGGAIVVNAVKRTQPRAKAIVLSAWPLDAEIKARFQVDIDAYIEKGGRENYIAAVFGKLEQLRKRAPSKQCFVIMPFSATESCSAREWTEVFRELVKPTVERAGLSYACERSKPRLGNIIEDILDALNRADVVIADVTDRNPNVFYELGVRHAIRDATILIAQRLEDVPFDLQQLPVHVYDWKTREGKRAFRSRIRELLILIDNERGSAMSPVRKYLKL